MAIHTLSIFLALATSTMADVIWAPQLASNTYTSGTPMASKVFTYPNIPEFADQDDGVRGHEFGYNLCNATTEGQASLCQTAVLNALDDFCVWSSPTLDIIADTEAREVAWCTKPGRGTRVIPAGAITGVQFMRTSAYLQVVGFIDQTQINLPSDDSGGELDPHGADGRGNPLGGLVYSFGFPASNGNNGTYVQAIEWHNFMGGNMFGFKICDPTGAHAADYCQHIYDRIGIAYNMPNNAQNNTFVSCEGDLQDFPGIYTDASGATQTYTQPPESLGAISTMPYQPRVPASSNCVTYASSALFSGQPTPTAASSKPASSAATRTGSSTAKATGSTSGSAAAASQTASSAGAVGISAVSAFFGVVFSVLFLA